MYHISKNAHTGEYLSGEENFFYQVGIAAENVRGLQQRGGKPDPGQQTTKEEESIRSVSLRSWRGKYHGKDKAVY
jgi:hypothetical protein